MSRLELGEEQVGVLADRPDGAKEQAEGALIDNLE